jgi:hypothetical protein
MIKVKRLTPGVLLNQAAGYVQYLKFKKNQLRSLFSLRSVHTCQKGPKYLVRHFVKHLGTLNKLVVSFIIQVNG